MHGYRPSVDTLGKSIQVLHDTRALEHLWLPYAWIAIVMEAMFLCQGLCGTIHRQLPYNYGCLLIV